MWYARYCTFLTSWQSLKERKAINWHFTNTSLVTNMEFLFSHR